MELPSRSDYPDYYQIIRHPIALQEIKVDEAHHGRVDLLPVSLNHFNRPKLMHTNIDSWLSLKQISI